MNEYKMAKNWWKLVKYTENAGVGWQQWQEENDFLSHSFNSLSTTLFSTWELEKLRPSISFWIADISHLRKKWAKREKSLSTNQEAQV